VPPSSRGGGEPIHGRRRPSRWSPSTHTTMFCSSSSPTWRVDSNWLGENKLKPVHLPTAYIDGYLVDVISMFLVS
jgi:hypothetical protein